jgi:hypothetical protein
MLRHRGKIKTSYVSHGPDYILMARGCPANAGMIQTKTFRLSSRFAIR